MANWDTDRERGHGYMDWDRRPEARRYGNERDREAWERERAWRRGGPYEAGYSGQQDWAGSDPERRGWDRSREDWERERRDWNRTPERWASGGDPGTYHEWRNDESWQGRSRDQRTAEYGGEDVGNQGIWGTQANRTDPRRRSEWNWDRSWGGDRGSYGGGLSSRRETGTYGGGLGQYGERGRFTGRGPKGWSRSDERIREDVNERLTEHSHIDASDVEVQVSQAEVTLTGTVEDRQAKRLAEDIAESVSGVREVHNQLRVQPQHEPSGR